MSCSTKMDIQEELLFLLQEANQMITYKFTSNNFDIPTDKAKWHLQSLLDACRGRGDDGVTATYFLAGPDKRLVGEHCSAIKCMLVSEDRLAAARASLASVTSEHVYSVQRQRAGACHPAALLATDAQQQRQDPAAYNSRGPIRCSRAALIPESELAKRSRVAAAGAPARSGASAPPSARSAASGKTSPLQKVVKKESTDSDVENKADSEKEAAEFAHATVKTEEDPVKDEKKAGNKRAGGGIAAMFANASAPKKTKAAAPQKPTSMMASFLQKGAAHPAPPAAAQKPASKQSSPQQEAQPRSDNDQDENGAKPSAKPVRFGAKKSSARKRKEGGKGGATQQKRRRILAVASDSSDSGSNAEDSDAEPEAEQEPAPSAAPVPDEEEDPPATQSQSQSQGEHRRRRKLVSKTFQDEEGFMVTKKVYESCSDASDSEEPPAGMERATGARPVVPPSKGSTAAPEPTKPAAAPAPAKTKQPGIMNFFKKK